MVVLVTGSRQWATTGRVAALRKQLDVPFVLKPFTVDQVIEAVEEAVQRWTNRSRQMET